MNKNMIWEIFIVKEIFVVTKDYKTKTHKIFLTHVVSNLVEVKIFRLQKIFTNFASKNFLYKFF